LPQRSALISFGSVSFAYFAYAGLFSTYAPLWFASLGFSALAIGSMASLQSATRLFTPYAWAWLADHSGRRVLLLQVAIGLSLSCALAYLLAPQPGWTVGITVALFMCTAAVIPISESALSHLVSPEGALDTKRYGRVRVWGSVGFVVAVTCSGFALQALGVAWFPVLVVALLAALLLAAWRLPVLAEPAHAADAPQGALTVLREPVVAWFFGGVFLTVLAHTSLYTFFSLYLVELGYSKSAVGLIWAFGVAIEVFWFWFQSRWVHGLTMHAWLVLAALVTALRLAAVAGFGSFAWVLVLSQVTHAVTFAAQHTACIAVVNRHFPGRLRGRGQALYAVLGYGASGVIGGVAGGALSDAFGFAAVFWAGSAAALLAAGCCWRSMVLERRSLCA
jgi:MFS transporter, PPP family, 3-phenylpropionic acid transporter